MGAARGQVQRILAELSDYSVSDEEFQEQLQAEKSNDRAMPITYAEFLLQNPINLVKSQRGNDRAEYLGFLFDKNKLSKPDGKKQYWQCCKHDRKDGGCKARLHTLAEENQFIQLLGHPGTESGHNHEVDPVAMAMAQVKLNMKRRALDTQEKPIQIFNQELQNASMLVTAGLNKSAARKVIRRTRIRNEIPVAQANAVEYVFVPDQLKYYDDGGRENFLLADSGEHVIDPDRVMIFGRARNLEWSNNMKNVYVDGTFSITPSPFNQVYVMLAEKEAANSTGGKYVFPILYCLLKNKNRATYDKMFGMIKAIMPHFNLCFRCFRAGLMQMYRDSTSDFALTARMLMSLAFVPLLDVYECFRDLQAHLMREEPRLEPVIRWFSKNYVGTLMRPPPFPVYLSPAATR